MRRVAALIVHNWPLKVGAIVLATLLYAGLALSQSAQRFDGQIPILPRNLPASAVLVTDLGNVTEVRYFAPADIAARVTSQSFSAYVDLQDIDPTKGPTFAPVHLDPVDPRISIVGFSPTQVRVELDPLTSKSVRIRVVYEGSIPPGLQVGQPQLSVDSTTVSGPLSLVKRVTEAQARVIIQPNGLDIDEQVSLVPVDALGDAVRVDVEPATVRVQIRVGKQADTKTLPVNPVITGQPAIGFDVGTIQVDPVTVTVSGDSDALASLMSIDTAPVSIDGASADVAASVPLALPNGVEAVGGKDVSVSVNIIPLSSNRTYSAGIVLAGARDDRTYAISTSQVSIVIGGPVAELARLDPSSFTVIADVSALPVGTHTVQLSANLPQGLSVVSISPPQVSIDVGLPQPSPSPAPTPTSSSPPTPTPSP